MFEPGQRVRVKETAFGGSTEPADVAARGAIGTLIEDIDDGLWLWRNDDGSETAPIEAELEAVEEEEPRDFVAEMHYRLANKPTEDEE